MGLGACTHYGYFVDGRSYTPVEAPAPQVTEVIRPGDELTVLVFGEEALSARGVRVGLRGTVSLPLLGEVAAAGKQPSAFAKDLERALSAYVTTPHVTVRIEQSPVLVTVIGEARNNGQFKLEAPVRLVEVLAQAGGLNEYADESAIFVLRGSERIRFTYEDIIRGAPHARAFEMKTGDVLVIE